MLIQETAQATGLTKKAIEYYVEQELVCPTILENGYRDFSADDIARLRETALLRKLGLSIEEVKAVLCDPSKDTLHKISVQQHLKLQKDEAKAVLLEQVCNDRPYAEVSAELEALDKNATIAQRLLDAFPGYYGRFLCLHFARFLDQPILTQEQQCAYESILEFIDCFPCPSFPEEVQAFLRKYTEEISIADMQAMQEKTLESIQNPEQFLSENKEALERYLSLQQTEEFRLAHKIKDQLRQFQAENGYYDTFLPAMKTLSPSYAAYHKQMEQANHVILKEFPEGLLQENVSKA